MYSISTVATRSSSMYAHSQRLPKSSRALPATNLNSFLQSGFPREKYPRILLSGDGARQIVHLARTNGFDLIIMPTHAGFFRRTLLGSTTAKVLNEADCPVLTTQHAETISPGQLEHRELVCGIGLSPDSERVIRYASETAKAVRGNLTLVHVIPARAEEHTPELQSPHDLVSRARPAEKNGSRT